MAHEQKLHLKIVATLGDSFSKIFTSTNKKMHDLSMASRDLNSKMANINGFREVQKKAMESGIAFHRSQKTLLDFKRELGSSEEMTKKQARELDRLTLSVKRSAAAYEAQTAKLKSMRGELKAAGMEAKNLSRLENELRHSLEKTNEKMASQKRVLGLARASSQIHQSARNARSGALGATIGAGATAAAAMYDPLRYTHEMNKVHILGKDAVGESYNPKILEELTQKISRDYGISLVDTAKTASSYLLGGLTPKETQAMLVPTFDLAVASDTEVEEVGGLMKALKASFHMGMEDMGYLANTVAKAANASDLSVADLAESSKYLLDLPHNFGMKLHEMLGVLSVSGDAQFKGSEAGTAAVQMLERLSQPKIQSKLADKLGVQTVQKGPDGSTQFRNIFDIVKDISQSMQGMGNAEREAILVEIFETQAGRAMRNVLGNIPKLETNAKSFSKDGVDANYAENLRIEMQNSPLAKIKQSYQSLSVLNTNIFETYKDQISAIADKVKSMTGLTSAFVTEHQDTIGTVVKASGAVLGLGLAWKVVKMLSLTALAPLFDIGKALLWIGTKTHPVVAAISGIATASYLLWKNWDGVVATMKSTKDYLFPPTVKLDPIAQPRQKTGVVNDNKKLSVTMNIKSETPKEVALEVKERLKDVWNRELIGSKTLFDMAVI